MLTLITFFVYVVLERSSTANFHDNIAVVFGLDNIVSLYNIGAFYCLHSRLLSFQEIVSNIVANFLHLYSFDCNSIPIFQPVA